jgi:hypothetical protein
MAYYGGGGGGGGYPQSGAYSHSHGRHGGGGGGHGHGHEGGYGYGYAAGGYRDGGSAGEAVHVKPTIAVDLDEVLGAFVEGLALFHNQRYGTKLSSADFRSYHFADVWGGTGEEATAKVLAFYESDLFRDLAPIASAAESLAALSAHFRFVVVTSRQHMIADKTRAWLQRHFPGVFADVVFGNHYDAGDGAVSR